jgi:hypothetical protein
VAKSKYFRTTVTDQNNIHNEMHGTLHLRNSVDTFQIPVPYLMTERSKYIFILFYMGMELGLSVNGKNIVRKKC